jgi:putative ABC transport system permease protein
VNTLYRTTSEGYQRAMGMRMAAGRWYTRDDMHTRNGVVISEPLARQLFADKSPLGQRVTWLRAARDRPDYRQPVTATVIGVLEVSGTGPSGPPQPEIYVPFTLETWTWGSIAARTTDAIAAVPRVRDALAAVDPTIPEARAAPGLFGVRALAAGVSNDIARRRLILAAIASFAVAALVLAAVGLYSVISYSVSLRTREVGVRIALGATRAHIARLVIREGARLSAIGVVLGIGGALAGTQLVRTMLFQVTPTELSAYLVTTLVLLGTAGVACYLPARRAARLSPIDAIRGE